MRGMMMSLMLRVVYALNTQLVLFVRPPPWDQTNSPILIRQTEQFVPIAAVYLGLGGVSLEILLYFGEDSGVAMDSIWPVWTCLALAVLFPTFGQFIRNKSTMSGVTVFVNLWGIVLIATKSLHHHTMYFMIINAAIAVVASTSPKSP
mmetsp:Transcript_45374/g.61917  ORF Transcript_45374/g.61917 Transcript_45374/m.61917 type:complete len:148 (+) Transcript_45374:703-1146(+)